LPRKDFDLYVVLNDMQTADSAVQGAFVKAVKRF
jgi:hypothetical protein